MISTSTVSSTGPSTTLSEASIRKEKILTGFARISQFCVWPFLFVIFHTAFKIDFSGRENLKKIKAPFVIIANHISFYDSFLFRIAFGAFTPHLPLRFMAVKIFDWRFLQILSSLGVVDLVYGLFGVFTVVLGQGIAKGLETAIIIVRCGGNVVIYPEGSINKSGVVGTFKNGAAVLAKQTNTPVLPVSFRFGGRGLVRKNLIINIGEPIYASTDKTDIENTAFFRAKIEELYRKMA